MARALALAPAHASYHRIPSPRDPSSSLIPSEAGRGPVATPSTSTTRLPIAGAAARVANVGVRAHDGATARALQHLARFDSD